MSGSIQSPTFNDGTVSFDAAIDLSLLLAEVVAPPFHVHSITFSEQPTVQKVGGASHNRSFEEKVFHILNSR